MATLRKLKLYGYFGDCPDKNLKQDIVLSLYQENDAQLDIQLVDYKLQELSSFPTPDDVSWKLYNRSDGSEAFGLSLADSEVTLDGSTISVRLHASAVSELAGTYYMECNLLLGGYKLTLFTGTAVFTRTTIQLQEALPAE